MGDAEPELDWRGRLHLLVKNVFFDGIYMMNKILDLADSGIGIKGVVWLRLG